MKKTITMFSTTLTSSEKKENVNKKKTIFLFTARLNDVACIAVKSQMNGTPNESHTSVKQ